MWSYGFFNSVNGDRVYNAQQMSSIFEGLISDGVYESVGNRLAVQPNSGMTIRIADGRGWFNKHWVENTTDHLITLEAADVTLNRYAAICVRVDDTDSVRNAVPYVKYGEYATTAVKPVMTRSDTVNEYCLAYVYIRAGVTEITASAIEDTRADESLCGWVTGLIEQLKSATLFEQFTAIFNEWFSNLADNINENTEAMLVDALPTSRINMIPVSSWVSGAGGYYADVTITGMNTTKTVICEPETAADADIYSSCDIQLVEQKTNTLTFKAKFLPTDTIVVKLLYMGK